MKVVVKREDLARGLRTVGRAISSRTTLPVLHNVLIATDEDRLRLSATDLELAMTVWVPAEVQEEGATTVPAHAFTELVSRFEDPLVALTYDEQATSLHITSGSSKNKLRCISADEFPPMPAPDMSRGVTLSVAGYREMVQQVVFAASNDDARPVLTGVLLDLKGDVLTAAASDGYRLSVRKMTVENHSGEETLAFIVPARAMNEVARAVQDGQEQLQLVTLSGRKQVVFQAENVEVVSQLIEGTYPPYEQIIPKRYHTRSVAPRDRFVYACRRVEIFAREGAQSARLKIMPGDDAPGEIRISATAESTGSSENVIPAVVEGDALEIAFNVHYLREALEAIPGQEVVLETTTPSSPAVLRPVDDENFIHIIMPMHL